MRTLVVDLETTGLDERRHGVVEFGAVWLRGPQAGEEFAARCRPAPGAAVDPEALAVNGCDWLEAGWAPYESQVLAEFLKWVGPGDVMVAGMNPFFDLRFLRAMADEAGLRLPFPHRVLDVHGLAVRWALVRGLEVPDRGLHSDAVMTLLGLPVEARPHRAICGARAAAAALEMLLTPDPASF